MTDSMPRWSAPGAQSAPATRWPPVNPVDPRRPVPAGVPQWRHRPAGSVLPARPTYQETHRITPAGVGGGAAAAVVWFLVTALLGVDLASTMWVMLVASLFALGAAWLLASYGDRGAAVGVAAVAGAASAVVGLVVEWHALGGTWILW
ncbi:hypothetical protein LX16_2563 [Stackebrandtia albiflava]|uniref:Uncharacterized protein n=1 Tax=Stackebrandtia albiflava TaxID=406432 RepID=A0A562V1N7_9ACTN|nr:hypothetical protein [Stackebrandtia albiflava]TWJ11826.1 hypothetical protein LX16_2563 [Stackebrandtia albiflava]